MITPTQIHETILQRYPLATITPQDQNRWLVDRHRPPRAVVFEYTPSHLIIQFGSPLELDYTDATLDTIIRTLERYWSLAPVPLTNGLPAKPRITPSHETDAQLQGDPDTEELLEAPR